MPVRGFCSCLIRSKIALRRGMSFSFYVINQLLTNSENSGLLDGPNSPAPNPVYDRSTLVSNPTETNSPLDRLSLIHAVYGRTAPHPTSLSDLTRDAITNDEMLIVTVHVTCIELQEYSPVVSAIDAPSSPPRTCDEAVVVRSCDIH